MGNTPKFKVGPAKKRPGPTAKSLANLKPAKKGEPSRNPLGAGAHNHLVRAFNKVHQENFREALEQVLDSDPFELDEMCARIPGSKSLRRLIAIAMRNAINTGDYGLVERIADRLFGKVADKLNLTATSQVTTVDKQILKAAIDELESEI